MASARHEADLVDEADLPRVLRESPPAGSRAVVTRDGRPVAAVVSLEDLELLEALEDRLDLEAARKALRDWQDAGAPSASLDDLLADLNLTRDDLER